MQHLCDRHRGIGSDGIVLIQPPKSPDTEFHMEFFNPDGSQSFCGNGSRCAYAYWCELFGSRSEARFTAIDGEHSGIWKDGMVSITLSFQGGIKRGTDGASVDFINTGSPHELVWVDDPDSVSIMGYKAREEGTRNGMARAERMSTSCVWKVRYCTCAPMSGVLRRKRLAVAPVWWQRQLAHWIERS